MGCLLACVVVWWKCYIVHLLARPHPSPPPTTKHPPPHTHAQHHPRLLRQGHRGGQGQGSRGRGRGALPPHPQLVPPPLPGLPRRRLDALPHRRPPRTAPPDCAEQGPGAGHLGGQGEQQRGAVQGPHGPAHRRTRLLLRHGAGRLLGRRCFGWGGWAMVSTCRGG
jgi:hypothetical protein